MKVTNKSKEARSINVRLPNSRTGSVTIAPGKSEDVTPADTRAFREAVASGSLETGKAK